MALIMPPSVPLTTANINAYGWPVPTMAVLGDSISNQNTLSDDPSKTYAYNAKGYCTVLRALLQGRFKFPMANNFGVSGETTTQILARVPNVIAAAPTFCCVLGGTNDAGAAAGGTWDYVATKNNLITIINSLLAAGIIVISIPITPRSLTTPMSAGELTNAQKGFQWINRELRKYALTQKRGKLIVADADVYLADATSTAYVPIALTTADGLHPVFAGAYQVAKSIQPYLDPLLPNTKIALSGQQNTYDATWNPNGNRLPTGQMIGTGGTAGTGASGSVATGWAISRTTGATATATCSKETENATTGQVRQVIALGGTAGVSGEVITMSRNITPSATTYAAGDKLVGEVEIEGVTLANVQNIALRISDGGPFTYKYYGMNSSGNVADRAPATLEKILVQTPEFTAQTGSTSLTFAVEITVDASVSAASGSVKIGRATIRTPD